MALAVYLLSVRFALNVVFKVSPEVSMRIVNFRLMFSSLLLLTTGAVTAALAQATKVPQLDKITLPKGFKIQIYRDALPGARSMALSPSGILLSLIHI